MKRELLLLWGLALPTATLAGTMGELPYGWQKMAALSLGPAYVNPGEIQTIVITPDVLKTYALDDNAAAILDGELFLGGQRQLRDNLRGQLGLAIGVDSPARISGMVWEDANQDYNNFNYNYTIQHERIAVKGKLLSDIGFSVSPYASVSLGVAINTASGFTINPLMVEELPAPPFASNTEAAFTYTLGAGFQKSLNQHWQIGAGYEFEDWGRSVLGRMSGQTTGNGPSVNHVYTHELQFTLTWLAGE